MGVKVWLPREREVARVLLLMRRSKELGYRVVMKVG